MKRLFLEGGAQRSMFTAGVLDAFMDEQIEFDEVYGISAGALNAVTYLSHDRGRNLKQAQMFISDPNYIGVKNLLTEKSVFNFNYMFYVIPQKYLPLDRERFDRSPMKLLAGAYECETGKTVYFHVAKFGDPMSMKYLQATSSLPYLSQFVEINGKHYADGGVGDSFALGAYREDGAKSVMVQTREKGYRKEGKDSTKTLQLFYGKYPHLVRDYGNRPAAYNRDLERIEQLEREGKMLVIRPSKPVTVRRTEHDIRKLEDLYQDGLQAGRAVMPSLKEYLGIGG